MDELNGDSSGAPTPCGSRPANSAKRSVTTWRWRYGIAAAIEYHLDC